MITMTVRGNPYSIDETMLALLKHAVKEMERRATRSATVLVDFPVVNLTARVRVTLVSKQKGASRRKPPRMARSK